MPAFEHLRVSKQGLPQSATARSSNILLTGSDPKAIRVVEIPRFKSTARSWTGVLVSSHLPHLAISANQVEFCLIRVGLYQHGAIARGGSDTPCANLL